MTDLVTNKDMAEQVCEKGEGSIRADLLSIPQGYTDRQEDGQME